MSSINLNELFDYKDFFQSKLFERFIYPWEVIKGLDSYMEEVLEKGVDRIVGEGVKIDPSAKIEGKIIIGRNSTISDSVLIRGNCIIGENVFIGHAVEIKHSVILNNTAIAHLNYIGDSIVGNNVNIGGGAIIANWRFDKKNVVVKRLDERIDTGLEKFGASIGDHTSIGVNAVLNPGTVLGKGSLVYPLVSVSGSHAEDSIIKQ